MATENHGWYSCPGCGRRTDASDDLGDKPLCDRCDPAPEPEPVHPEQDYPDDE